MSSPNSQLLTNGIVADGTVGRSEEFSAGLPAPLHDTYTDDVSSLASEELLPTKLYQGEASSVAAAAVAAAAAGEDSAAGNSAAGSVPPLLQLGQEPAGPSTAAGLSAAEAGLLSSVSLDEKEAEEVFRWQTTSERIRLIQEAGKGMVHVPPEVVQHKHLRIYVVGAPGVGKSSLISNLFTPFHLEQVPAAAPSNGSSLAAASSSRKDLAGTGTGTPRRLETSPGELSRAALEWTEYTATATDAAGGVEYHYSILEAGGSVHSMRLVNELRHRAVDGMERHLAADLDPSRQAPLSTLPDPRCDVCVFLLPPRGLLEDGSQMEAVARLAQLLPVIPVVAKADSLSNAELSKVRSAVRAALSQKGPVVFSGGGSGEGSAAEALGALLAGGEGAGAERLPLVVMASSEGEDASGRLWPARRYPWGATEAFASPRSDLLELLRLLLETGFERLKAATEARYLDFRRQQLDGASPLARKAPPALPAGQGPSAAASAAALPAPLQGPSPMSRLRRRRLSSWGGGLGATAAAAAQAPLARRELLPGASTPHRRRGATAPSLLRWHLLLVLLMGLEALVIHAWLGGRLRAAGHLSGGGDGASSWAGTGALGPGGQAGSAGGSIPPPSGMGAVRQGGRASAGPQSSPPGELAALARDFEDKLTRLQQRAGSADWEVAEQGQRLARVAASLEALLQEVEALKAQGQAAGRAAEAGIAKVQRQVDALRESAEGAARLIYKELKPGTAKALASTAKLAAQVSALQASLSELEKSMQRRVLKTVTEHWLRQAGSSSGGVGSDGSGPGGSCCCECKKQGGVFSGFRRVWRALGRACQVGWPHVHLAGGGHDLALPSSWVPKAAGAGAAAEQGAGDGLLGQQAEEQAEQQAELQPEPQQLAEPEQEQQEPLFEAQPDQQAQAQQEQLEPLFEAQPEQLEEQPAEQAAEQLEEQPAEQVAEQLEEQPAEQAAEHLEEQRAEQQPEQRAEDREVAGAAAATDQPFSRPDVEQLEQVAPAGALSSSPAVVVHAEPGPAFAEGLEEACSHADSLTLGAAACGA